MYRKMTRKSKHCHLPTAGILISGFASSIVIYLSAGDEPYNPLAEYEGSKKFAYELERIGGKGAVLANEFSNWFAGLWSGRQLAFTLACITALLAAGYYWIASGMTQHNDENE